MKRAYDEEDAAISAFHRLCCTVGRSAASNLQDRGNLWRLLTTITERKIANRLRYEQREKRDSRRTMADICILNTTEPPINLDALAGREPTPEFAAEFADLCDQLIESLGDKQLREIATLKLQNYEPTEIADALGCTRRTIERKLIIIRTRWHLLMDEASQTPPDRPDYAA